MKILVLEVTYNGTKVIFMHYINIFTIFQIDFEKRIKE